MLRAADFRAKAWMALSGKWGLAVGTGFVASLLGDRTALAGKVSFNSSSDKDMESLGESFEYLLSNEFIMELLAIIGIIVAVMLVYSIFVLVVGGPITLGYA